LWKKKASDTEVKAHDAMERTAGPTEVRKKAATLRYPPPRLW